MEILLKRIYENEDISDGYRILADKLYPRGIKKENLHIDLWAKDIAPSDEVRKFFHQTNNFEDFYKKYTEELLVNENFSLFLEKIKDKNIITLLTAGKDIYKSQLVVLKDFINKNLSL
ncbi:MAG: DUF488 family protein [Capnocytophaga sp.]|nr:DUF488 family protein [Capnocytophaga sp.]